MRLNAGQVDIVKGQSVQCFGVQAGKCLSGSRAKKQQGFTMVELIAVMVIVGVLAAVAVPRFFDRSLFDNRGFSDDIRSGLRLAQKLAIAQRRNVCVTLNPPGSVSINVTVAASCDTPLPGLTGSGTYQLNAPGTSSFTMTLASPVTFNSQGIPGSGGTVTVTGEPAITLDSGTGYVY